MPLIIGQINLPPYIRAMQMMTLANFYSRVLKRNYYLDIYIPDSGLDQAYFFLFNDGQILDDIRLLPVLQSWEERGIPVFAVGIHASDHRLQDYGVSGIPDYKQRGAQAGEYKHLIVAELLPYLKQVFRIMPEPDRSAIIGFSLGGLSALDIGWSHPEIFTQVGVFSGSFWWRSKAFSPTHPDAHRIMHERLSRSFYKPGMRFWFQTGTDDESSDRNNNGVIDSIDDTQDVIRVLESLGYENGKDIAYLEIAGGRHEPGTWADAFPELIQWIINKTSYAK
ncbi:MAG: alpha/beta hydrolase-fold protein [Saprospiraceae bacterium]